MGDPYPSHFEIDIDRDRVRKYLRAKWFFSWIVALGLFGAVFALAPAGKSIEGDLKPWAEVLAVFAGSMAIGLVLGCLIGAVLYLLFSHWLAATYANSLVVAVEGPFLRICENWGIRTDRRLHFRAIVDYAIQQGPLRRRFGIESLIMTTTGHGSTATISIPGIKDGLKTRDMLSEVDRLRENAP